MEKLNNWKIYFLQLILSLIFLINVNAQTISLAHKNSPTTNKYSNRRAKICDRSSRNSITV